MDKVLINVYEIISPKDIIIQHLKLLLRILIACRFGAYTEGKDGLQSDIICIGVCLDGRDDNA